MKVKFFLAIALLFGIAINSASAQSYGKDRRDRDRVVDGRRGDFRMNDGYRFDRSPKHFRKYQHSKRFYGHSYRHHYRHDRRGPKAYSHRYKRHHRFY
jgi:hypothetical protein